MDLDIVLTDGGAPDGSWDRCADHFAALEAAGCAGLWFTDHLFFRRPTPDALVAAAIAATATDHVRIGTAVLQVPLRSPAEVAKVAATLQIASGGRFNLGVGVGVHEDEYVSAGAVFATRGSRLDGALDALRGWWSDRDDAEWFRQQPVPPHIPVWVGGGSPRALARVIRSGDGWMPMFISPDRYAPALSELRATWRDTGRSGDLRASVVAFVSITGDNWSRGNAEAWVAGLFPRPVPQIGRRVITGNAQQCAAGLARFQTAGADLVLALPAGPNPVAMAAQLVGACREVN